MSIMAALWTTQNLARSTVPHASTSKRGRGRLAQQGNAVYGGLGPSYLGYVRLVLDVRRFF